MNPQTPQQPTQEPIPTLSTGPGANANQDQSPKPLLEGATEYEYVTILNPLPFDFWALVGQSRPVNVPFQIRKDPYTQTVTSSERDVAQNYGLPLKNPDHTAKVHIANRVLIPSGKTINLLGNEAQVVARQLVNEIMQREKNSLMLADPFARNLVERRIILARRPVSDALGSSPVTVQEQLKQAVQGLNEQNIVTEEPTEQAFPHIPEPTATLEPTPAPELTQAAERVAEPVIKKPIKRRKRRAKQPTAPQATS